MVLIRHISNWTDRILRLINLWCRHFIRRCKQGCLQFVILKPFLAAVTLILYANGKYHDGNFNPRQSYLYLTIIYTISYSLALYALALFYAACKDLLRPFHPVPKFIIIKSVVFLTYWQVIFCPKLHMCLIGDTLTLGIILNDYARFKLSSGLDACKLNFYSNSSNVSMACMYSLLTNPLANIDRTMSFSLLEKLEGLKLHLSVEEVKFIYVNEMLSDRACFFR